MEVTGGGQAARTRLGIDNICSHRRDRARAPDTVWRSISPRRLFLLLRIQNNRCRSIIPSVPLVEASFVLRKIMRTCPTIRLFLQTVRLSRAQTYVWQTLRVLRARACTEVLSSGSGTDRELSRLDGATKLNSQDTMRTTRVKKVASARIDTKLISISDHNLPRIHVHSIDGLASQT